MRHADFEATARRTFSGIPFEKGVEYAKKMSRHSAPSFIGEVTYPAYEHVPVSWVLCEKDLILTLDFQNSVIATIEKDSGNKVHVVRLDSDHCPNVGQPIELANAIRKAIVGA